MSDSTTYNSHPSHGSDRLTQGRQVVEERATPVVLTELLKGKETAVKTPVTFFIFFFYFNFNFKLLPCKISLLYLRLFGCRLSVPTTRFSEGG